MLAVAAVVWIGLRGGGAIPLSLFVDLSSWWIDLGIGLAAAAGLIGGWELMARSSEAARRLEEQLAELLGEVERGELLALAVLSGFAEELFFRGAVQQAWGWLIASVLFAVLHTGPGRAYRVWTLFAGIAGLVLGGLMLWRGALLAPVVAHVTVNAVNLRRLSRRAG